MCTNPKPKSINAIKRTYYYCWLIELHSTAFGDDDDVDDDDNDNDDGDGGGNVS